MRIGVAEIAAAAGAAALGALALPALLRGGGPPAPPPLTAPVDGGSPREETADRGKLRMVARTSAEVRAVVAFCDAPGDGDRAALLEVALRFSDPLCAGNALRALGNLDAVAGDPRLLALADDPRPRVRHELARALGKSRRPQAVRALGRLLSHEDRTVRLLAIQSLGRCGGEEAERLLAGLAERSTDPEELAFLRSALRG
jgi:HEAT repeat protein